MAERRVRAPERTLTAVRAIAPVAGMPPTRPQALEASPWPSLALLLVRAGLDEELRAADRNRSSAPQPDPTPGVRREWG